MRDSTQALKVSLPYLRGAGLNIFPPPYLEAEPRSPISLSVLEALERLTSSYLHEVRPWGCFPTNLSTKGWPGRGILTLGAPVFLDCKLFRYTKATTN